MVADSNISTRFCVVYYRAAVFVTQVRLLGLSHRESGDYGARRPGILKFLLWCILLVVCWPVALIALVLYPLVWLLLLPFRVVGIAVEGALGLVWAIVTLPARMLRAL